MLVRTGCARDCAQVLAELARERSANFDFLHRARMAESQARSVKKISRQRSQIFCSRLRLPRRAIQRVADHWMAQCGKMNANLMRAARVQVSLDQAETRKAQSQPPVGARRAAFLSARGHPGSTMQIARHG